MTYTLNDEIRNQEERKVLLVLTGPTGAGKDAVMAGLVAKHPSIKRIVTTTSRLQRPGETEGNPYHFIPRAEFEKKCANNEFFEWVEFRDEYYGTEKTELAQTLQSNNDAIWKIEMKGIKNIYQEVKSQYPRSVFIFLTARDIKTLEQRVLHDPGGKHKRWNEELIRWEMDQYYECEYVVVNEDNKLDTTVQKIASIIEAKRMEIIQAKA